jgi:proline dehydrogenase
MLRRFLLWLSRNERMRRWVMRSRLTRRVVNRFIAGNNLDETVTSGRRLNKAGILLTMDHLGEAVSTDEAADVAGRVYLKMLDRIKQEGLKATVSLKPTQLGLAIDADRCGQRIRAIVEKAVSHGLSVEIDMEDSPYTDATLKLYEQLLKVDRDLRVCLQSYLNRTDSDIRRLIDLGGSVRLVKGAYREPEEVAVQAKREVNDAFLRHMQMSLTPDAVLAGFRLAVASHDDKLVQAAKDIALKNRVAKKDFEFQFLYGIRTDLQESLSAEGYTVRVYQPYGEQWYPYFMRRLAERPANLWFLVKNLVRR